MQYLKYPTKNMGISQNYNGKYSHWGNSHGSPADYPIDECCGSSLRDYFYAPCDLEVKRVYGVGNKGTNTIWLQSSNKVKLANGKESYVTIMVIHPNDDTLKSFKAGQKYKQGDRLFKEGNDGQATGNHFHISVSTCKFSELPSGGWKANSKGYWVISKGGIKPEQAFYVDNSFTKIKNSAGLKFKTLPKVAPSKSSVSYYKKYTGKSQSLVEALNSIGVDSSFTNRFKIANKNGIKVYVGTANQNIKLLDLLKNGKLVK